MRCYDGYIPESDYFKRYGYTQAEYRKLREDNQHIQITYFPQEAMYLACVPGESYRQLGDFCSDKMDCLKKAINIYNT